MITFLSMLITIVLIIISIGFIYDIMIQIIWYFKIKSKTRDKVERLKVEILKTLSKELSIKIVPIYYNFLFFKFSYRKDKYELYFPQRNNYVSITNKTKDIHKSINFSDRSLYLEIVKFISDTNTKDKRQTEVRDDYYGL
jgi:hypothetical protein